MRPSLELPIDGPSPLRVIGGGAAALVGAALAIGGPLLCVQAATQAGASLPLQAGTAAAMQANVARWMEIAGALALAGLVLVLAGVLALALTPGAGRRRTTRSSPAPMRPYGIAGTALATPLVVALVGWLSSSARALAALEVFQDLAARVPYARQFGPSEGERTAMLQGILSALAYLAATVMFLPIARGLRLGWPEAAARASRWASVAVAVLAVDAAATVVAALVSGAPVTFSAIRIAVLAPWPILGVGAGATMERARAAGGARE